MFCQNTKRQAKKNAATVSGAAFQRKGKQVSDGSSSGWFRRQSRFTWTWTYRQIQRAANTNQQGTEKQGDPAEQGKIDGHAEQQAVWHRAGGLN